MKLTKYVEGLKKNPPEISGLTKENVAVVIERFEEGVPILIANFSIITIEALNELTLDDVNAMNITEQLRVSMLLLNLLSLEDKHKVRKLDIIERSLSLALSTLFSRQTLLEIASDFNVSVDPLLHVDRIARKLVKEADITLLYLKVSSLRPNFKIQ